MPVCPECGTVDSQCISYDPEWVTGGDDDDGPDPNRCGMPIDTILFSEKWGMGTRITGGKAYAKMATINMHASMNHRDRALFHAYAQFDRVGKQTMGLQDNIVDQAKITYRKFNEDKLTRGAIRSGIKAHCILLACKNAGVSRSLQEIADAFEIPVKDVSRTTEVFKEVIGDTGIGSEASDMVSRAFNLLDDFPNKNKVKMKTIRACEEARENPLLMSKTPKGILSAVMYMVLKEFGVDVDRARIASICDVSVPTLVKIENLLKNPDPIV